MKIEAGGRTWSFEGLPQHMLESIPHTCKIVVRQAGLPEREHVVQLERDGRPLTLADVRPGWCVDAG